MPSSTIAANSTWVLPRRTAVFLAAALVLAAAGIAVALTLLLTRPAGANAPARTVPLVSTSDDCPVRPGLPC
jgi:hypothetical protein